MHRMSLREVQEVARLAAESGVAVHGGGPTVHKVADALGLPPTDVEMLLDQARQGRSPMRDFKIVAGIAALVAAFLLGFGTTSLVGRRAPEGSVATSLPPTPSGSELAAPPQGAAASHALQPAPGGSPVDSNESSSQLYAQGAPLESKTLGGDVRRGVETVRRSLPSHVAKDGGPQPVLMSQEAH